MPFDYDIVKCLCQQFVQKACVSPNLRAWSTVSRQHREGLLLLDLVCDFSVAFVNSSHLFLAIPDGSAERAREAAAAHNADQVQCHNLGGGLAPCANGVSYNLWDVCQDIPRSQKKYPQK